MRYPGYVAPPLRVIVVTEQEHHLICHILEAGLKSGWLANGYTAQVLDYLKSARSIPARRRTEGWLTRWWPRTVRRDR